jgi:uncharacterized protein (TIGR03435 family)
MRKFHLLILSALLALPGSALGQEKVSFEVASVKQNKGSDPRQGARLLPGGRIEITNMPLRLMVRISYGATTIQTNEQIVGGPAWAATDRWDIVAKAEGDPGFDAASGQPLRLIAMLKTLLEERFKIMVHTEKRDVPTYALVVASKDKLAQAAKESQVDCYTPANAPPPGTPPDPARLCGIRGPVGSYTMTGISMEQLAQAFSGTAPIGRPVFDRTGLSGRYDWKLQWVPMFIASPANDGTNIPNPAADTGPNIFTALTEQVGLKLQSERAQVDYVVIDSAERPTEE